ncbi:hypothetical protein PhCBS80983_g02128 [Powellomyces hirtus]|uniref:Ran guanine nucleotide release factor n=1 Tax=Powellomyces hirtus TaxID=109895 RepID=A0A507E9T8_9FUNG|nr:hypothetical protein DFJ77DRAFT_508211 [Powellomyces hirtus]TPX59938.1 hypothetical protein PhCBS80983_g02128 [Powellomyces hirtus]
MPVPSPSTIPTCRKDLYGGAMSMSIPQSFADVSMLREVPSNQEVFADQLSDQSIMIELLELASDATTENAGKYHYAQLAQDNEAVTSDILSEEQLDTSNALPFLPSNVHASIIVGRQTVAKFNESSPDAHNVVIIYLALIRIPQVTTDLVISHNQPIVLGSASSSTTALAGVGLQAPVAEEGLDSFRKMLQSLKIMDWGLFGETGSG